MRLIFDGPDAAYHPATGLELKVGEHDYPDDKAEALIAAGLRRPAARRAAKEGKE